MTLLIGYFYPLVLSLNTLEGGMVLSDQHDEVKVVRIEEYCKVMVALDGGVKMVRIKEHRKAVAALDDKVEMARTEEHGEVIIALDGEVTMMRIEGRRKFITAPGLGR